MKTIRNNSMSVRLQFASVEEATRQYFTWINRGCDGTCQGGSLYLVTERNQKRFDALSRFVKQAIRWKGVSLEFQSEYVVRRG